MIYWEVYVKANKWKWAEWLLKKHNISIDGIKDMNYEDTVKLASKIVNDMIIAEDSGDDETAEITRAILGFLSDVEE